MCGGAVGDVVEAADQAPTSASGGKSSTDLVGNPAGNMAFTTPDSTVGKAGAVAGAATLAAPAAAAEGSAAAGGTAAATGEGAAASMPAAVAEGADVTAGAAGTSAAATGSDVLGTIKTLAPAVSAGANLLAAGAAVAQANAAGDMAPKPNAVPATPQAPTDPDVSALRKKNALLFGADSPLTTDLTKGTADTGNLGRTTLLGGSTKLGG